MRACAPAVPRGRCAPSCCYSTLIHHVTRYRGSAPPFGVAAGQPLVVHLHIPTLLALSLLALLTAVPLRAALGANIAEPLHGPSRPNKKGRGSEGRQRLA